MSSLLRISEAASLGLHVMALLSQDPQTPVSTRQASSAIGVSDAHLSKVLQRLAKVGLVKSVRGPKGGFVLGKPSDSITLLDVYESIEGPLEPNDCLFGTPVCSTGDCILGDLLATVNELVLEQLGGTRLSDLGHVYAKASSDSWGK
jgi:Rrf2 family protein